jgi:hypothetical protein
MVPLFTDRPKDDPTPGRHTESIFAFLDRSGRENSRRVRNLLEPWFEAYPVAERDRLRNHRVTDFNAGFFRVVPPHLLQGCWFHRDGSSARVPNASTTPEFLVVGRGPSFYAEARMARDMSDEEVARRNVENHLYEAINAGAARDGAFLWAQGPWNTRVSAVLIGAVFPWNILTCPLELYHNPWGGEPLATGVLPLREASLVDQGLLWKERTALQGAMSRSTRRVRCWESGITSYDESRASPAPELWSQRPKARWPGSPAPAGNASSPDPLRIRSAGALARRSARSPRKPE